MQESVKVVAVLAANPALSSILSAVLAASPALRVRQFESVAALTTYMRLAPIDLLVCDFDCEAAPAGSLAAGLRGDRALSRTRLQIIALASQLNPDVKRASLEGGIDEIIVKPMSPRYLLERVIARLRRGDVRASGRPRAPASSQERLVAAAAAYRQRGDNVIPLFGDR